MAQGICKGLGDGLVFCPTISLVATYFSKNRVVAMASAASGGATGGIIFPVIAQQLLPRMGFAWTVRIMAFVICFNSVVVLSIARVRLPPRRAGPLVEWSAFKDLPYTLFCAGMSLNLWAVFFTYFYVSCHTDMSHLLSRPNAQLDQHLWERHYQSIFIDVFDHPSRHECHRDARSLDLWPHCGPSSRSYQHSHAGSFHIRYPSLLLGNSRLAGHPLHLLRHLRLLCRGYSRPLSCRMRKLNLRPDQDRGSDRYVFFRRFHRLFDWPAHRGSFD